MFCFTPCAPARYRRTGRMVERRTQTTRPCKISPADAFSYAFSVWLGERCGQSSGSPRRVSYSSCATALALAVSFRDRYTAESIDEKDLVIAEDLCLTKALRTQLKPVASVGVLRVSKSFLEIWSPCSTHATSGRHLTCPKHARSFRGILLHLFPGKHLSTTDSFSAQVGNGMLLLALIR
jgi:hypothetical protein